MTVTHIPEKLVKDLAKAMYPVLIPIEEQSMQIQAENAKLVEMAATAAWLSFANRACTWIEPNDKKI